MSEALHTESRRRFRAAWIAAGGTVEEVRRTGEERYRHPLCAHPIRGLLVFRAISDGATSHQRRGHDPGFK